MREDFAAAPAPLSSEKAIRSPLRVRFEEEDHAAACARQLDGVCGVHLKADGESWELNIEAENTEQFVMPLLDAVRQALAGAKNAFALVTLDGREYHLYGE